VRWPSSAADPSATVDSSTISCTSLTRLRSRALRSAMSCIICGAPVRQRDGGPGRRRLFCSDTCRRKRRREHTDKYRREGRYPARRTTYRRVCELCGDPFTSENKPQRTCSRACGKILGDRTRGANARARNTRPCERCGASFLPANPSATQRRAGHVQRFCSAVCARAKGAAGRLAVTRPGKA